MNLFQKINIRYNKNKKIYCHSYDDPALVVSFRNNTMATANILMSIEYGFFQINCTCISAKFICGSS